MTTAELVDQGIPQQSIQLLPFIPCIVTKLGGQGVLVNQLLRPGDARLTSPDSAPYILSRASPTDELIGGVYMRLFPSAAVLADGEIVSVNGAGDTLLGAVVAGLAKGAVKSVEEVIPLAQEASLRTLKSPGGVSRDLVTLRSLMDAL
jgi:pseudouridine-5'-phosphate glycosidase/pseudouridine kinase